MGFSRGDKVGGIGSGNSQVFRVRHERLHSRAISLELKEDISAKRTGVV